MMLFRKKPSASPNLPPPALRWDGRYRIDKHTQRDGTEFYKVHYRTTYDLELELLERFQTLEAAEACCDRIFNREVVRVETLPTPTLAAIEATPLKAIAS